MAWKNTLWKYGSLCPNFSQIMTTWQRIYKVHLFCSGVLPLLFGRQHVHVVVSECCWHSFNLIASSTFALGISVSVAAVHLDPGGQHCRIQGFWSHTSWVTMLDFHLRFHSFKHAPGTCISLRFKSAAAFRCKQYGWSLSKANCSMYHHSHVMVHHLSWKVTALSRTTPVVDVESQFSLVSAEDDAVLRVCHG